MTGSDTSNSDLSFDEDVYEACADATKILCLVPEHDPGEKNNDMWLAVDAAISLARSGCRAIMFYDRSEETWGDTDHSHEIAATAIEADPGTHLRQVLFRAADNDISASVWRSTIPTLGSGTLNASQIGGADFIVVPATGGRGNPITDLLLGGSDDVADAIGKTMTSPVATEADADVPVAQVSTSGRVSLLTR